MKHKKRKEIGTCLNLNKYLCQYNERLMIFTVNSALLRCGKKNEEIIYQSIINRLQFGILSLICHLLFDDQILTLMLRLALKPTPL